MPKKNKNRRWMNEHLSDEYVKKARQLGYRSRATFKLLEIDQKDKLLKPGAVVVDLGAAPGGWSQVAVKHVGNQGKVIALDLLPMAPLTGVTFIQSDFCEQKALDQLFDCLNNKQVDLVISDMAPNISGSKVVDQPKSIYLAELALDFAGQVLRPDGQLLVKIFQGEGIDSFRRNMQHMFSRVLTRKPKASRPASREVYLLGKNRIV